MKTKLKVWEVCALTLAMACIVVAGIDFWSKKVQLDLERQRQEAIARVCPQATNLAVKIARQIVGDKEKQIKFLEERLDRLMHPDPAEIHLQATQPPQVWVVLQEPDTYEDVLLDALCLLPYEKNQDVRRIYKAVLKLTRNQPESGEELDALVRGVENVPPPETHP